MPQQANNSDLYEDAPVCGLQFGHFTKLVGTGYFLAFLLGAIGFSCHWVNIWLDQKTSISFLMEVFCPLCWAHNFVWLIKY